MNGNRILLDTNIILYLIDGNHSVYEYIYNKNVYISFITEIELLSYFNEYQDQIIKELLDEVTIVDINEIIKKETIILRRNNKLKLPDSIILATSKFLDTPILTADKKLKNIEDLDVILFEL
jgi:hypothetical protein